LKLLRKRVDNFIFFLSQVFGSILDGYYFGIPYMDSIGSMIIAGYIFYVAYTAFKESMLVLVDAVKNPEMEDQIVRFVKQKFNVNVDDVLIRPLGHNLCSAACSPRPKANSERSS